MNRSFMITTSYLGLIQTNKTWQFFKPSFHIFHRIVKVWHIFPDLVCLWETFPVYIHWGCVVTVYINSTFDSWIIRRVNLYPLYAMTCHGKSSLLFDFMFMGFQHWTECFTRWLNHWFMTTLFNPRSYTLHWIHWSCILGILSIQIKVICIIQSSILVFFFHFYILVVDNKTTYST